MFGPTLEIKRTTSPATSMHPLLARENLTVFALVTVLFFLWGLPNNLNDVLIRQFMGSFQLSRMKAGLIQSAFYLGYFTLSTPAALRRRAIWRRRASTCVEVITPKWAYPKSCWERQSAYG